MNAAKRKRSKKRDGLSLSMNAAKRKRSKKRDGHDYLSPLPDCLIHHILSFMPIKDVPKTCILSKRWRSTWVGISDLVFNNSSVCDPSIGPSFVDLVIKHRSLKEGLNKFSINLRSVYKDLDESKVNSWLRYAVDHCVKDLSLNFPCYRFCFPQFLYCCPFMVKLDISCSRMICPIIINKKSIAWTSLKALTIRDAVISDDLLGEIFKGSPALEFLELESCYGMNRVQVNSSSRLTELVIDSYEYDFHGHTDFEVINLVISAPSLLVLRLRGVWHQKIVKIVDVSSVVEVEIDFALSGKYDYGNPEGAISYANTMKKFSRVTNVTIGDLCHRCLAYDEKKEQRMDLSTVEWKNVTLKSSLNQFFRVGVVRLLNFLQHVEKLVLYFDPTYLQMRDVLDFPEDEFWARHSLKCWDNKLRVIEIIFVGYESDRTISKMKWLRAMSERLCPNSVWYTHNLNGLAYSLFERAEAYVAS